MTISIGLPSFMTKSFTVQKIFLKMHCTSCLTTYHYVKTFEVDRIVYNIKVDYLKNRT